MLWWLTLFLTLPFGVRSQHEDGVGAPGTDPGAPIATPNGPQVDLDNGHISGDFRHRWWAYGAGYLSIERLSKLMGMPFSA